MSLWDFISNGAKSVGNGLYQAIIGKSQEDTSLRDNNIVGQYQNYLRNNGYGEEVASGVTQGLNHGYREVDDWIKQYNAGQGINNPINIPHSKEEVALARQGLFNHIAPQSQVSQPPQQRVGGAISDILNGFKENFYNGFTPNNWQNNAVGDIGKGVLYRAGEGLGSIARVANSPLGRGLAVAGLVGLNGGTTGEAIGYGLGTAAQNQQNVLNDRLYRQSLINNYGYSPEQVNQIYRILR